MNSRSFENPKKHLEILTEIEYKIEQNKEQAW